MSRLIASPPKIKATARTIAKYVINIKLPTAIAIAPEISSPPALLASHQDMAAPNLNFVIAKKHK